MLGCDGCTIYDHRPRTCRTYDCRVFAAAGVTPDQPAVALAAARWSLEAGDDDTRVAIDAIPRAARWLREHPEAFPAGRVPGATGLALAALAVADLCSGPSPDSAAVRRRLGAGAGRPPGSPHHHGR
jgi:hypothetical protein